MSAAERETPAGEAMREAAIQLAFTDHAYTQDYAAAVRDADEFLAGPIASELARLTAERDRLLSVNDDLAQRLKHTSVAYCDEQAAVGEMRARASAAEAALTTQRADRLHDDTALATAVARARREALEEAAGRAKSHKNEFKLLSPECSAAISALSVLQHELQSLAASPPEARQTETETHDE